MNVTKENVAALIGTTEGFSAEAVQKQLDIRQVAVTSMLERYRREKGIKATTKGAAKQ